MLGSIFLLEVLFTLVGCCLLVHLLRKAATVKPLWAVIWLGLKKEKEKEGVKGLNTRTGNCRTLSRATLRTLTMCKQNMATLHSLKSSQNMKIEIVSIINQFTLNKLPSHGTMDDKDINVEVPDLRIGRMKHSLNFSDDFWGPPSSQQVHFPLTAAQPQVRVFSQVYWECSPWALFLQQPLK